MYCPPLTIRVVDCRSFGRFTLVGCQLISTSQNKNIPRALKQILRLERTHLHRSTNSSTPQQCEVKQNSNLVHWGTSKGLRWGTNWTTSLMSNGDISCPIWATNRRWTSGGGTKILHRSYSSNLLRLSHDGTISPLESNGLIKSKETVISLDYVRPISSPKPSKEKNNHRAHTPRSPRTRRQTDTWRAMVLLLGRSERIIMRTCFRDED